MNDQRRWCNKSEVGESERDRHVREERELTGGMRGAQWRKWKAKERAMGNRECQSKTTTRRKENENTGENSEWERGSDSHRVCVRTALRTQAWAYLKTTAAAAT
eukprot:6214115-Pleurochrysis_carterae.AAC.4